MSEETQAATGHEGPQEASHPKPLTYVIVAMTLAIITAIEVAIFYATGIGHAIIPVLVVLSAGMFALVAMFYMHLRYDARLFTVLFFGGLALAASVIIALMLLSNFF